MTKTKRAPQWSLASFLAVGFEPADDGVLARKPLVLRLDDDDWLTFFADDADGCNLPQLSLGHPGLWTPHRAQCYAFELPARALSDQFSVFGNAEAEDHPAAQLAAWAEATLRSAAPGDWQAPPEIGPHFESLEESLVVRQGPWTRRIELLNEENRLALRVLLVNNVTASMSAARRTWIERKLRLAQHQWRMVRLGFAGTVRCPTLAAEVDLTGCPPALCHDLLGAAVRALRQVVEHELPTSDVLYSLQTSQARRSEPCCLRP